MYDRKSTCSLDGDKVCLDKRDYESLVQKQLAARKEVRVLPPANLTRERDMKVLKDPLYPALARADRNAFEGVANLTYQREINVPTRPSNDTYRLVGYLSNEEDKTGSWKLMARTRDRNRAEYYMIPTNNNIDMKIQITDDMVTGEKLRDIDIIPKAVTFNTPLLSKTPYTFTEIPKADLVSPEYL
jgi:hypothetical protein